VLTHYSDTVTRYLMTEIMHDNYNLQVTFSKTDITVKSYILKGCWLVLLLLTC